MSQRWEPVAAGADASRGPLGRSRNPWWVVIVGILTLGLYLLRWYWVSTRERDAFSGRVPGSHRPIRVAVLFIVFGTALAVIGVAGFAAIEAALPLPDEAYLRGALVVLGVLFVGAAAGLVGIVALYTGLWRWWTTVNAEQRSRNVERPLRPRLMLALSLCNLVPYVGAIPGAIWVYHTQVAMNEIWAAHDVGLMTETKGE